LLLLFNNEIIIIINIILILKFGDFIVSMFKKFTLYLDKRFQQF